MYLAVKRIIYETIEEDITDSLAHKIFEAFIVTLIALNVLAIIIESCISFGSAFFRKFEIFSVMVFSLEYILRLWTVDLKFSDCSKFSGRVKFAFSPLGIIDLLAVLPFYTAYLAPVPLDGRILRVLRLLRLLRILKLYRFLDSFRIIRKVVMSRKYELIITGFVEFIMIVIASTLMYELEHTAQPDKFPDILSAFWWAVATLTTIGYGDVYPVTGAGKLISAVVSLVGIGLIALPTGILSTSFIEEYRNEKENNKTHEKIHFCPHCGKKLDNE